MKKSILALLVLFIIGTSLSAQCPMCKTALKSNREGGQTATVGNGINQGILFLMAMPYLLVGAAGFAWYKNRQKKNG